MKDVAKMANVSMATVSRILNGDVTLTVRDETREAVIDAAQKLGYEIKTKKQNQIFTFGIVQWISSYAEKEDTYYYNIRMSVENYCILNNIHIKRYYRENLNDIFSETNLDGLLCIGKFSQSLAKKLNESFKEIVFIDSNPDKLKYNAVYSDFSTGTKMAMDHFVSKGHRKIAFIGGREYLDEEKDEIFIDSRDMAYLEYMKQHKLLEFDENNVYAGDYSADSGYDIMQTILESEDKPTAVLCGNDVIAIGAMSAINESTNANKISVIGFNNNPMTQFYNPPLTSVHIDTKYMGELGCRVLIGLIEKHSDTPIRIVCAVKLIVRESVHFNN